MAKWHPRRPEAAINAPARLNLVRNEAEACGGRVAMICCTARASHAARKLLLGGSSGASNPVKSRYSTPSPIGPQPEDCSV